MPGSGLSGLAQVQLAAWEVIAEGWEWSVDGEGVRRCGRCGGGIVLELDSAGRRFLYTHEQSLALTVLHLRSHHPELDPDRG